MSLQKSMQTFLENTPNARKLIHKDLAIVRILQLFYPSFSGDDKVLTSIIGDAISLDRYWRDIKKTKIEDKLWEDDREERKVYEQAKKVELGYEPKNKEFLDKIKKEVDNF